MEKSLKIARVVTSIGFLLTIVPLAVTYLQIKPNVTEKAALYQFWTYVLLLKGLLPIGLALALGGLGFITIKKRALKQGGCCSSDKKEKDTCCT
jgi:hypothetical protein